MISIVALPPLMCTLGFATQALVLTFVLVLVAVIVIADYLIGMNYYRTALSQHHGAPMSDILQRFHQAHA